eukprot:scaffold803_cov310-Pinguiococcus_pyrenoidosus.AAC.66
MNQELNGGCGKAMQQHRASLLSRWNWAGRGGERRGGESDLSMPDLVRRAAESRKCRTNLKSAAEEARREYHEVPLGTLTRRRQWLCPAQYER